LFCPPIFLRRNFSHAPAAQAKNFLEIFARRDKGGAKWTDFSSEVPVWDILWEQIARA
jgi:hypothetical protein